MAAPNVQICINDEVVKLMWSKDISGSYSSFNLYWSLNSGMAGEAAIATRISNVPDTYYSKEHITYAFRRSQIAVPTTAEFYVRLKGVNSSGVEDNVNPGATRFIPSVEAQRDEYNAVQMYGFDPVKKIWKKVKVADDGTLAS